jgi:hypothetical protein
MFIVSIGSNFLKVDYNNLQKYTWTDGGMFNGTMWHKYRLTVKEGILHVYVDGKTIGGPWTTERVQLFNHIRFGCLWSVTYQGIIDWDYVWVAQDEETAPPMIPVWDIVLNMTSSPSTHGWTAVVGKGNAISLPLGSNDITPPHIGNPPTNKMLLEGESDWIEWNALDEHPAGYKIYLDGLIIEEREVWDGTPVSYLIQGLTRGVYNYTIEFYDEFGNYAINMVAVTIELPVTTPFTTTGTTAASSKIPPAITPGFSLSILIVIAIFAYLLRRRV